MPVSVVSILSLNNSWVCIIRWARTESATP